MELICHKPRKRCWKQNTKETSGVISYWFVFIFSQLICTNVAFCFRLEFFFNDANHYFSFDAPLASVWAFIFQSYVDFTVTRRITVTHEAKQKQNGITNVQFCVTSTITLLSISSPRSKEFSTFFSFHRVIKFTTDHRRIFFFFVFATLFPRPRSFRIVKIPWTTISWKFYKREKFRSFRMSSGLNVLFFEDFEWPKFDAITWY